MTRLKPEDFFNLVVAVLVCLLLVDAVPPFTVVVISIILIGQYWAGVSR